MKLRIMLSLIIVLALAGVADSGYAVYQHYSPAAVSSCDINETISCTAINQSEYSVFMGIPVAAIGVAGYLLLASLAGSIMLRFHARAAERLLLAAAGVALAFSIWLTWIEIFVLEAVCPLCVLSLLLIMAITALSLVVVLSGRRA